MSDDLPKAVSESTLTIGDATLRVAQLDNGQRCIDADDVQKFLAGGGDAWQLADVWQTDTEQELATLTAERDKLLAAANRVLQWFKTYDSEDAAVLDDLTTVVLQVEKRQAEQQQ